MAAPEVADTSLSVEVEGNAQRASGRLSITLADGQQSLREIPAGTCREVLASMAVISALVLEGHGLDAPLPEAAAETPVQPAESARRAAQARGAEREPVGPAPRTEQDEGARLRVRAVVQGSLETAVAPGLSPGIAAGADFTFERAGSLVPNVELLGRFVAGGRETTRFGDARFQLLALALSACPVRLRPVPPLSLRPCLRFEAGQLRADGRRTLDRATQLAPWLGLGPALRSEAALASFLAVQLEAGATALFQHDRFIFQPELVAHDVPPVAFGFGIGLMFGPS